MKFRHEVPTINLDETESPIKIEYKDFEVVDGTTFHASIPKGYKYPSVPEPTKITEGDILPAPETVKTFPDSLDEIVKAASNGDMSPLDDDGRMQFDLERGKYHWDRYWECHKKLPECIKNIIAEALRHEASINSNIWRCRFYVDIRLQKPEHHWAKPEFAVNNPHFDVRYIDTVSYYLLSSAPTTVAYTGRHEEQMTKEQNPADAFTRQKKRSKMVPQSHRPWTLVHANYAVLHSQPWDLFPEGGTNPRFFIRLMFY